MCTEFILPQSSKKRVSGRSMDFKKELPWIISGIPAKTKIEAFLQIPRTDIMTNKAYTWDTIYDMVGIAGGINIPKVEDGRNKMVDGLNSEGLSGAALWLPNSKYPKAKEAPKDAKMISALDIVSWAISVHKTIKGLKSDLEAIRDNKPTQSGEILAFWDPFQYDWAFFHGNAAPLHFQFHDKDGNSLVMEFRNGKIELTDNTDLGVMTNYPFIDWHRINVENYLSVNNVDTNEGELVDMQLDAFGHGNGTMGLSTSPTPPSRFIRTAKLLSFGTPWLKKADDNEAHAFAMNILGNVNVLRLMSIDKKGDTTGDFTQWVLVRNHKNPQLFLRTADGIGTWNIEFKDFIKAKPCYQSFGNENNGTILKAK